MALVKASAVSPKRPYKILGQGHERFRYTFGMRSNVDIFLLIGMLAGMLLGRVFELLAPDFAAKCYEFGGLALLIFVIRRLCFLPYWIVTGREQ
ncbi:MAG: hypothetical protein ACOYB3_10415 [Azonexus sp.]